MTTITILATSDLHGFLPDTLADVPGDPSAANAHAAGILAAHAAKRMTGVDDATLLIDAGDYLLGSAYATFTARSAERESPLTRVASACGYTAMALGNHDFDHGTALPASQNPHLHERLLCCNVTNEEGHPIFHPYRLVQARGIRVGIVGAVTGALPQLTAFRNTQHIHVLDAVESIRTTVNRIRADVDLLIVAYHGGIECDMASGRPTQYDTGEDQAYRILSTIPGIDGLICGHQHRNNHGECHGIPYVQPGYQGNSVGFISYQFKERRISRHETAMLHPTTDKLEPLDPTTMNLKLDEYRTWLDQPIDTGRFGEYITLKTGIRLQRFIWRKTSDGTTTIREFHHSFPKPYTASVFRLTWEELRTCIDQGLIQADMIPATEAPLGGYQVITNTPEAFPTYRLESRTVDNLFDEYLHWLKQ